MWVMSNLVSVRFEMVLVLVQDRCTVYCQMYHRLRNRFGRTRWYSWEMRHKWKIILVYLETVFALVPCSCTVCAERTVGSEIGLDTADGTPR